MRNLVSLTLLIMLIITGCSPKEPVAKDTCKIIIEAKNYPSDSLVLVWNKGDEFKQETIILKNGKGEIDIKVPEYSVLSLMNLDESKSLKVGDGVIPSSPFYFFAENGERVSLSFDNKEWPIVKLSGGKTNTEYMKYLTDKGTLEKDLMEKHDKFLSTKDSVQLTQLNKEQEDILSKITDKQSNFIKANPSSYVSLFLLQNLIGELSFEEFEQKYNQLDSSIKNSELGKSISEYIENSKKTAINQQAPYFEKKDKDGKLVKLSDYKGKYILIDFWGSWCMPCRQSHPHLVKLYEKYSPKGLQFINIAQESSTGKNDWLNAIKEDRLVWTQILNNEDQNKYDVVNLYSIIAFPTKILINPEGKIIARLVGEEPETLDAELVKIFGE
ncbi:TlpA disulfide reductase family protein [Apibacter sp. HY039]|uniref:TlpA disulfide reductase family protein n=1 Tax=Apibacter sp. HY039 TaxID=2501476 RepID=UPI000FEB95B2|nr:TlpA disulfide reductase family protein [Apibacter sp. HY039]